MCIIVTDSQWRLVLPYDKPPLTLNQRGHWAKYNGPRADLRQLGLLLARQQRIPHLTHIHTRLAWRPPDNRRRDEDNIILTAKPLWDGLVDAGVVDDDTSVYMTKYMPMILTGDRTLGPRLWLDVWTQDND